jgi:hypothetical protein
MDNFDPNYVWYIGGALCVVAVFAFLALHLKLGSREQFQPAPTE